MTWSFRLVRLFGTDVKVHFTFILLLAFLFVSTGRAEGAQAAWWVTGFFLTLFLCVLLHEFGHILMARRFGIRTPDVILLPIGGVARLERIPEEPRQELQIALAGPAVTLAIAALLWGWLKLAGESAELLPSTVFRGGFAADLLRVNVMLFLFNLLPAFPLDGGRVLRSLLATRLSYVRATRIAATGGQILAMVLGVAGLFYNPLWLFIALFVYLGAGQETAQAEARAAGRGIIVDQMMVTKFETLPVHATLREAVDRLLDGEQREFPVVDNSGKVEGILTRDHLIRGLTERGPDSLVADAMARSVPVLQLGLPFDAALERLRTSGLPALPVGGQDQRVVGLLTLDNITDLILVRRAVAR